MTKNNGGGAIRVLVAAASPVRRRDLEAVVRDDIALKLVGSASGLVGLATRARELQPDVVLVDLPSPDVQFTQTTSAIEENGMAVVGLIDEPDANWASRALRAGVRALLPRDSSASEIQSAIRVTSRGMVLLDPELARELVTRNRNRSSENALDTVEELTPREIEVLRMMAEGLGNKEIAARLVISDHTVKFHISSILAKVGASSRTEAVTLGIRMGLILL
jgi:DNA-binding NarL/FixJ family response regulator